MCGIIKAKVKKGGAKQEILAMYKNQKHRGTEGFGYITIENGKLTGLKRSEDEKTILEMLKKETANEILFHHRFPTSTPNFEEATHPIVVSNDILEYDYYTVHNGVISNPEKLKVNHNKLGFVYSTAMKKQYVTKGNTYDYETEWNDSESFAIDLALYLEGKQEELDSLGRIAFISYKVDKKTKEVINVYYGRNHKNPLMIYKGNKFESMSSENKKGGAKNLTPHVIHCLDYKTGKTTIEDITIGDWDNPNKNSYSAWNNTKGMRESTDPQDSLAFWIDEMELEDLLTTYPEILEDRDYNYLLSTIEDMKGQLEDMRFENNGKISYDTEIEILKYDIESMERDLMKHVREQAKILDWNDNSSDIY